MREIVVERCQRDVARGQCRHIRLVWRRRRRGIVRGPVIRAAPGIDPSLEGLTVTGDAHRHDPQFRLRPWLKQLLRRPVLAARACPSRLVRAEAAVQDGCYRMAAPSPRSRLMTTSPARGSEPGSRRLRQHRARQTCRPISGTQCHVPYLWSARVWAKWMRPSTSVQLVGRHRKSPTTR